MPPDTDQYRFCVEYFNEPVIDHLSVVRLVGYAETAVDIYYILVCPERGIYWASGVGEPIPVRRLRGQGRVLSNSGEEWDDFWRLDEWLEINGAPKLPSLEIDLRPDDTEQP